MRSKTVVLPAPLGPISPSVSPRRRSNETSSTATIPPNRFVRPLVERTIGCEAAPSGPSSRVTGGRPAALRACVVPVALCSVEEDRSQEVTSSQELGGGPFEPDLTLLHEVGALVRWSGPR